MSRSPHEELRVLGALAIGAGHPVLDETAWSSVAKRALVERLAPLVYWRQKRNPSLPVSAANRLRRELYRTAAVNQILFRELGLLVRRAASRGLPPPTILKGAALATSLYDDAALRPMSDVDLLVPRETLTDYVATAESLGYRRAQPEMTRWVEKRLRYHAAMAKDADETAKLELHWQIVAGDSDRRSPDIDWFHEHGEPLSLSAPPPCHARALEPTAQLLHLAAHAALQHGLERSPLLWLHDIHLVVTRRGESIDWRSVREQAERFGWVEGTEAALERCRELFDTPLPPEGRRSVAATTGQSASSRAEWVWHELSFVSFRERLRWTAAILFPRPAYVKWRYPEAGRLWPTRYLYRWCVVLSEGARAIWLRFSRPSVRRVDKPG